MRIDEFAGGPGAPDTRQTQAPCESTKLPEVAGSLLIVGLTASGQTFRPSDWAERLASVALVFEQGCPHKFAGLVRQERCEPEGVPAVRVSARLREIHPMAWGFMLDFARDNGLRSREEPWPQASSGVRRLI